MGLLGPSLEDLFMKTCRRTGIPRPGWLTKWDELPCATERMRKFSLKTVLMLGEQMINCIDPWSGKSKHSQAYAISCS